MIRTSILRRTGFTCAAFTLFATASFSANSQQRIDEHGHAERANGQPPVVAKARLQGSTREFKYQVVDGYAVIGDMVVGKHVDVQKSGIKPFFNLQSATTAADAPSTGGLQSDNPSASSWVRYWPNNTVYYALDPALSAAARQAITDGLRLITSRTSMVFKLRTTEANYVRVFAGSGCYSYVGMISGPQDLSIGRGCEYPGIVAHEFMHAMGWNHEQMRPDRDLYVTIRTENIQAGMEGNFTKLRPEEAKPIGPYDVGSIMHYGAYSFSSNGQPTIVPVNTSIPLSALGQRSALSTGDAASINHYYPAPTTTTPLTATLSAATLTLNQNTAGQLTLTLAGSTTDLASATVSGSSNNVAVIPNSGISVTAGTTSAQKIVRVTPASNATGTATITLRASAQSGAVATTSFTVTVKSTTVTPPPTTTAPAYVAGSYYGHGAQVAYGGLRYTLQVIDTATGNRSGYVVQGITPGKWTQSAPWIPSTSPIMVFWLLDGEVFNNGGMTLGAQCSEVIPTTSAYRIGIAGTLLGLAASGSTASAPIVLRDNTGGQTWRLTRAADGYYQVVNQNGLALDVSGALTTTETAIVAATKNTNRSQQWCPLKRGSYYELRNRNSGLPLAAAGSSANAAVKQRAAAAVLRLVVVQ